MGRLNRFIAADHHGDRFMTMHLSVVDAQSGTMRFLYGYVRADDGVRRFGWMAQDALEVSATACP